MGRAADIAAAVTEHRESVEIAAIGIGRVASSDGGIAQLIAEPAATNYVVVEPIYEPLAVRGSMDLSPEADAPFCGKAKRIIGMVPPAGLKSERGPLLPFA